MLAVDDIVLFPFPFFFLVKDGEIGGLVGVEEKKQLG